MLNRRLTGGLAWAGLLLVIGVPSADLITRGFSPQEGAGTGAAVVAPVAKPAVAPAKTAEVAPQPVVKPSAKPAALPPIVPAKAQVKKPEPAADPIVTASTDDKSAVGQYLSKGKKLPSYITDASAAEPAVPSTEAVPATEVASLPQSEVVAPIPMPASMRPAERPVLIGPVTERPAVIRPTRGPVPPADVVGADELEGWETGSLADYLARQGLLNGSDSGGFFAD